MAGGLRSQEGELCFGCGAHAAPVCGIRVRAGNVCTCRSDEVWEQRGGGV